MQYSNSLVLMVIAEHSELAIMLLVKMFFIVYLSKIPKEINHYVENMSSTYF